MHVCTYCVFFKGCLCMLGAAALVMPSTTPPPFHRTLCPRTSTFQRLAATSVTLPTTKSPIAPWYRLLGGCTVTSLFTLLCVCVCIDGSMTSFDDFRIQTNDTTKKLSDDVHISIQQTRQKPPKKRTARRSRRCTRRAERSHFRPCPHRHHPPSCPSHLPPRRRLRPSVPRRRRGCRRPVWMWGWSKSQGSVNLPAQILSWYGMDEPKYTYIYLYIKICPSTHIYITRLKAFWHICTHRHIQ